MNHEINLPAAAAGARKARVPVDDGGLGTVALGHFAGVGLDLTAALSTPYDQPHHRRCGVAQRHRRPAIRLHPLRRRLPAEDGASRPCNGGDDPVGGCGGLSFARIAFNGPRRGESG